MTLGIIINKNKSYPIVPKVTSKCEHCDVRLTSLKTVLENLMNNLFVTSKKRILQFTNLKCCIKAKEPYNPPFYWCISSYLLL